MLAEELFDLVTREGRRDLQRVFGICEVLRDYCLFGDFAVNCYVDPMYTLDVSFVLVPAKQGDLRRELLAHGFEVDGFPHWLNAQAPPSELRIQFTTDPRYQAFLSRAEEKLVLGVMTRVARLEDVTQGKLWAYLDPQRRLTKRKKDELDLLRLAEKYPHLKHLYPAELRKQLEG
jgi:hypothetical protein